MWRRRARHRKIGVQGFAAQRAASTTPADRESDDAESIGSAAIRLFVLDFYRNQLADVKMGRHAAEGHLAMKAEAVTQSA
jgi:hypothetical protein